MPWRVNGRWRECAKRARRRRGQRAKCDATRSSSLRYARAGTPTFRHRPQTNCRAPCCRVTKKDADTEKLLAELQNMPGMSGGGGLSMMRGDEIDLGDGKEDDGLKDEI
eukprot:7385013-Prymnesium_polylepis.1